MRGTASATFTVVALLLALAGAGGAQVGAPNAAPRTPAGMVVGEVVDAAGAAVSEAIVQLSPRVTDPGQMPASQRVMTDDQGRFFFSELQAGDYFLSASKDGHATGGYGQRRPWGPTQALTLGEGERKSGVELRVWKYAVIGGTVVDEAGEPVVGIAVRALAKEVFAGRTGFGNLQLVPQLVPATTTDDRGMFRLAELSPGSYVVVVPSTHASVPAAFLNGSDPAIRTEMFWAGVTEVSPLGQPQTVQMGDFALMTGNRVLVPPPPTAAGRMQVYRTTYHPNATTASAATPISIKSGEERTDITIALRPVPAVRVSGRLVAPDGSVPPPTTIRLVGEASANVISSEAANPGYVGFETVTGMSDRSGRFTLLGVPAGEYVLKQASRFLSRALRDGTQAYWVSQPLTVGTEDIANLTVQLRPGLRVEGRFEFRGGNDAPPVPPGIVVFETPFGEPGQFAAEAPTGTFSSIGGGGQYIVRASLLGPRTKWTLQSVTLSGKDITDRPFDLQQDVTALVLTYTDRPSPVSGIVTTERGDVSASAVVLAFPTDPQRWVGYGATPRTLRSTPAKDNGAYTFEHLPPGDYYVVAVEAAQADGWQDPALLEQLAGIAARLRVAEGEGRSLDLRLRAIR